jgi:hypothetical protein
VAGVGAHRPETSWIRVPVADSARLKPRSRTPRRVKANSARPAETRCLTPKVRRSCPSAPVRAGERVWYGPTRTVLMSRLLIDENDSPVAMCREKTAGDTSQWQAPGDYPAGRLQNNCARPHRDTQRSTTQFSAPPPPPPPAPLAPIRMFAWPECGSAPARCHRMHTTVETAPREDVGQTHLPDYGNPVEY